MATISWKKAASGNWTAAADWSPAKVPGAGDDAKIGIAGLYTVSLTSPVTVRSVTVSDVNAVLAISAPGKTETISAGLTNAGTVQASGQSTLKLGGALDNGGTLILANGAALSAGTNATNNGMIEVGDNFGGQGDSGGSSLTIGRTLANNGDLYIGNSGLTKAVTVAATSLTNAPGGRIILDGGTGAGQAALTIGGAAPAILIGSYFLQGNSLIEFGSGHITAIGSNSELRLDGAQSRLALAGNTAGNSALTMLSTNDGYFDLEDHASVAVTAKTVFNNFGEIDVDTQSGGGSRLTLNGTLNNIGDLEIGGSALVLGGAPAKLTAAGLTDTGTIELSAGPGRATLDILGAALPTVTNSISLMGDTLMEFGSGSIMAIASGGRLSLQGPNARIALNSDTTTSGALAQLGSNLGEFSLSDGAAVATKVGFTNNGELFIDTPGFSNFSNDGGSSLAIGGTLINNNSVDIGNRSITAATAVSASQLINPGVIELTGSDTVLASLKINAAAPTTLAVGNYGLTGDALLQFGGGGITAIASGVTLSLDGAHSRVAIAKTANSNSALTGLTSNAGSFGLEDGAAVSTTKSLTNTGTLDVDEFGNGGSSLTVAGVLTSTSPLDIGNGGIIAATTVTTGGLGNGTTLDLTGGATISASLNVKAAAPTSVTNAAYNLAGDALLQFASGGIASIGTDGQLTLDGALSRVASGSATGSNSALTKLAGNTGTFSLFNGAAVATQAGFVNNGLLSVDSFGSGGSSLKIGGTLTNVAGANLTIGNSGILKATTVTAKGLATTGPIGPNTSAILLAGGTALATLDVTAAAPTTLTGSFSLSTNALLEFAGGAVTAIGPGASLSLTGKNARVAIAGNLSTNSALTTLASNAGSLNLEQGAVLVTKVGLTNNSFLDVDNSSAGGSSLTIGGGLTNDQTITIGNTTLTAATKVVTGALTNNADDTVTLTSGAAQAMLKVGGGLTNAGFVALDQSSGFGNGSGGSSLSVTGVLTNSGIVQIGNANITRATAAVAAGLANTGGTINLFGGTAAGGGSARASLVIGSPAPSVWTGTASLSGNSLLEFSGGGIATIASGARLSIDGAKSFVALAGKLGGNSALAGLTGNAGTFSLGDGATLTAGAVANSGSLQVDGPSFPASLGGSSLKLGGVLTNSGIVEIGNSGITAAASVTAAGIDNTGTIDLTGGVARAVLDIGAAAPATLEGTFNLQGNALLEFGGSASITKIDVGAALSLTGAQALVALSSKLGGNSALGGLASIAGTFDLEGGAALSIGAGLANAGTVRVDTNFFGGAGSSLKLGGTLTNSNFVDIGNTGQTAATKVTAAALANTATIDLSGGIGANTATLALTGASSDGGNMSIGSGGVLALGGTLTVTNSLVLNGGTVSGGTLAGSGQITTGSFQTGTLNHVTIAAGATFTAQFDSTLDDNGVTVTGAMTGGNSATLDFLNHGTDNTTNVSGFPTINLANGGANSLSLTDANFLATAGVITITDGDSGNTVDAHTLSSVNAISVTAGIGTDKLTGGDGGDIFTAGGKTTMTGNTGANQFRFLAAGSNTITDFKASSSNELVFSSSGFNLGLAGTPAPQQFGAAASTLFTTNATGKFANTTQRLLYDTANHELFASADGSGSKSHVVATLTDHASIATSQLFFVT